MNPRKSYCNQSLHGALYTDYCRHVAFNHEGARMHITKVVIKNYRCLKDTTVDLKPTSERARLCYLWDREMVEEADLVIAEASFPSTGLGIEMQLAEAKGTPIILCFRDFGTNKVKSLSYANPDHTHHELQVGEGFVTLMALGIPTIFRSIHYFDRDDGIKRVIATVNLIGRD